MGTNRFLSTANCMCASRGGDKITIEILMILATIRITASGHYFSSKIVEHTRMTRYSSDELRSASKGLFIWKWGTPGRCSTPLNRRRKIVAFTCNLYNPGVLG